MTIKSLIVLLSASLVSLLLLNGCTTTSLQSKEDEFADKIIYTVSHIQELALDKEKLVKIATDLESSANDLVSGSENREKCGDLMEALVVAIKVTYAEKIEITDEHKTRIKEAVNVFCKQK